MLIHTDKEAFAESNKTLRTHMQKGEELHERKEETKRPNISSITT